MTKDEIKERQRFLIGHGYNPGPIDGVWGQKTQAAQIYWENTELGIELTRVGYTSVLKKRATIYWEAGMTIDADGDPRCYHPITALGLDRLAYAGKPGSWWGIATDTDYQPGKEGRGVPYIQVPEDPAPGCYVSTTALQNAKKNISDPARYIDSGKVPFIVVPNIKAIRNFVKLGDIGMVEYQYKRVFVIVADVGPKDHIGEASIACANALHVPSNPRNGGVPKGVRYTVWPGSGNGKPMSNELIAQVGADLLRKSGV